MGSLPTGIQVTGFGPELSIIAEAYLSIPIALKKAFHKSSCKKTKQSLFIRVQ
jgi:hypothetical protein